MNRILQNDSKVNLTVNVNVKTRAANMAIIRHHCDPDILAFMRTKHTANGLNMLIHQPGMKRRTTQPVTIGRRTYILLTQGLMACVDAEHTHLVANKAWYSSRDGNTFYAMRHICREDGTQSTKQMHRFLYEQTQGPIPPELSIDHINGNGLDNRMDNLRLADRRLQMANSEARRLGLTSSRYPGVSWYKPYRKWRARVKFEGVEYNLAYYEKEEEANQARLEAISAYYDFDILPPRKPCKPVEDEAS